MMMTRSRVPQIERQTKDDEWGGAGTQKVPSQEHATVATLAHFLDAMVSVSQ